MRSNFLLYGWLVALMGIYFLCISIYLLSNLLVSFLWFKRNSTSRYSWENKTLIDSPLTRRKYKVYAWLFMKIKSGCTKGNTFLCRFTLDIDSSRMDEWLLGIYFGESFCFLFWLEETFWSCLLQTAILPSKLGKCEREMSMEMYSLLCWDSWW
jgi:hypothetical protein